MRRRGFTLLELMLVLAIMVILVALTFPALKAQYKQQKLSAAADTYRAALLQARSHAIDEGQPYRVCIVPGKGNLRVAPDMDSAWSGTGTPTDASGNPVFVMEATLSRGISLSLASSPQRPDANDDTALPLGTVGSNQWTTTAVLLPDGSARVNTDFSTGSAVTVGGSTDIMILRAQGRGLTVSLRALTGETTVQSSGPGIP